MSGVIGEVRVWLQRDSVREFFEETKLFCVLVIAVAIQIYAYIKIHKIVHQKQKKKSILLYDNIPKKVMRQI